MAAFQPAPNVDVRGLPKVSAVVAAIDFGTTHSGVAFSLRKDYQKNRLDIQVATNADASNIQTIKEPTAVLYDPEGKFHSFGQQAEDAFKDICQRNLDEAREWRYFSRFKMMLFDYETMTVRTELQDCWGTNTMPAIRVFSAAIRHLKDKVVSRLREYSLDESDVDWVITTPAIWKTAAKKFMQKAAAEAGIPNKQLVMVFEPEAAAKYCNVESEERSLRGERLHFDLAHGLAGMKFMVLDCGGGTSDVMVYEASKEEKGTLTRLHRPTGIDWGGIRVDDAFHRFLGDFLGPDNMVAITMAQMLDLHKDFEQSKRDFRPGDRVWITVPSSIKDFFKAADFTKFPEVKAQDDCLSIDPETFGSFFTPTVDAILDHVRGLLRHEKVKGVKTILMVGGLSQCQLLHDAVSKAFPDVTVVLPDKAEASVLMGAVLYRHEPSVIGWRVSVFTYGVGVARPFVEREHDPSNKWITEDGEVKCKDIFSKIITSGDVLFLGKTSTVTTIRPSLKNEENSTFSIFRTRNPNVTYTTDPECRQIGQINIHYTTRLPDQRKRKIEVWLKVGSTKLKARAKDTLTGEVYKAECASISE